MGATLSSSSTFACLSDINVCSNLLTYVGLWDQGLTVRVQDQGQGHNQGQGEGHADTAYITSVLVNTALYSHQPVVHHKLPPPLIAAGVHLKGADPTPSTARTERLRFGPGLSGDEWS